MTLTDWLVYSFAINRIESNKLRAIVIPKVKDTLDALYLNIVSPHLIA